MPPACFPSLSLSLSLSYPKLHTLQIFNSFIDVFFSVDPLSPSIYVSPSTVKTHSPFQAYTHQVSLNEFFINWSHFLSFSPTPKVFSSPSGRQINVLLSGFDSHDVLSHRLWEISAFGAIWKVYVNDHVPEQKQTNCTRTTAIIIDNDNDGKYTEVLCNDSPFIETQTCSETLPIEHVPRWNIYLMCVLFKGGCNLLLCNMLSLPVCLHLHLFPEVAF